MPGFTSKLLQLKSSSIKVSVQHPVFTSVQTLNFENSASHPLEAHFELPVLSRNQVLTGLSIQIGEDKQIDLKVMETAKAQ